MCYEDFGYQKRSRVIKRLFRRFDIYISDGSKQGFNKTRPYIILQEPLPNSTFLMCAPIRTPHEDVEITSENIDEYIKYMREIKGRIYVPIVFDDESQYRMIDLTNQASIHVGEMYKYMGTLVDEKIVYNIEFELDCMHGRKVRNKSEIKSVNIVKRISECLKSPSSEVSENKTTEEKSDKDIMALKQKRYELEDLKFPSKRGRPSVIDDKLFYSLYLAILNGEMDIYQAIKISGAKPETFRSRKKRMDDLNGFLDAKQDETLISTSKIDKDHIMPLKIPTGFTLLYRQYKEGKATITSISKKLNISEEYVDELIKQREKTKHSS